MAYSLPEAAVHWATELARGGKAADFATRAALTGKLGRWIEFRLTSRIFRLAPMDAEEVTADVIFKFATEPPAIPATAWGYLTKIVRSKAIDHIRSRNSRTPDQGFLELDAPIEGQNGEDSARMFEIPDDRPVKDIEGRSFADCIAAQLLLFEAKHAGYALLIRMRLEEMENDEMAAVVFLTPIEDVTETQMNRLKSRLSTARDRSLEFFRKCQS